MSKQYRAWYDKQEEMVNKCSSDTLVEKKVTKYGYDAIYNIDGKKVTLSFNQYSNGDADYDDELTNVEIEK